VRDGRWWCEIHRRWRRRWYHFQAIRQLLQFGKTTRTGGLMTTAGGRERCRCRSMRVRWHPTRLYVEIGSSGAGRRRTGATAPVLDHSVGVLRGKALRARRHCHVVTLRDYCHVVRMGVRCVRMRMRHSGWHAHRRWRLLILRWHGDVRRVRYSAATVTGL